MPRRSRFKLGKGSFHENVIFFARMGPYCWVARGQWGKAESRFQCDRNDRKMRRMRHAEGLINWADAGLSR